MELCIIERAMPATVLAGPRLRVSALAGRAREAIGDDNERRWESAEFMLRLCVFLIIWGIRKKAQMLERVRAKFAIDQVQPAQFRYS
jgi:hypothetical protein